MYCNIRSADEAVVEFVVISLEELLLLDELLLLFELFKLRSDNELAAAAVLFAIIRSVAETIASNVLQFKGRLHCAAFKTNSSDQVRFEVRRLIWSEVLSLAKKGRFLAHSIAEKSRRAANSQVESIDKVRLVIGSVAIDDDVVDVQIEFVRQFVVVKFVDDVQFETEQELGGTLGNEKSLGLLFDSGLLV